VNKKILDLSNPGPFKPEIWAALIRDPESISTYRILWAQQFRDPTPLTPADHDNLDRQVVPEVLHFPRFENTSVSYPKLVKYLCCKFIASSTPWLSRPQWEFAFSLVFRSFSYRLSSEDGDMIEDQIAKKHFLFLVLLGTLLHLCHPDECPDEKTKNQVEAYLIALGYPRGRIYGYYYGSATSPVRKVIDAITLEKAAPRKTRPTRRKRSSEDKSRKSRIRLRPDLTEEQRNSRVPKPKATLNPSLIDLIGINQERLAAIPPFLAKAVLELAHSAPHHVAPETAS